MAERKGKRVCSGKCRAALSRRDQDVARRRRDQEIRALLGQAERLLAAAKARIEE